MAAGKSEVEEPEDMVKNRKMAAWEVRLAVGRLLEKSRSKKVPESGFTRLNRGGACDRRAGEEAARGGAWEGGWGHRRHA